MTGKEKNDYFYVCSLIEYIGRQTRNRRSVVVNAMGMNGIEKELRDAEVNHCLSFEQVADEVIQKYGITDGDFDTIINCKYSVPGFMDIGRLYSYLIDSVSEAGKEINALMDIFTSFISDEISNFKTGVYFENPDYLKESYKEGRLL